MQTAIKVGDIYIVYDKPQTEDESKWYQIGRELAEYYKQLKKWFTKHKPKSKPLPKVIKLKTKDYSVYDLPTVYRKWR